MIVSDRRLGVEKGEGGGKKENGDRGGGRE